MKRFCFSLIVLFALSLFCLSACREEARPNIAPKVAEKLSDDTTKVSKIRTIEEKGPEIINDSLAFSIVNNLRVREQPDLNSKVISMLQEGEEVAFLGEKSDNTESVELRGQKITAAFFKIKTQSGEVGWVFGGAVDFKKPVNTYYKAVIAFFIARPNEDAEVISDWSVYSSEALDAARKAGLITLFVDSKFNQVAIKDDKGAVIDVVNLANYAKKYKQGIVCLEKGKKPFIVEFSPEMEQQVKDYYAIGADSK